MVQLQSHVIYRVILSDAVHQYMKTELARRTHYLIGPKPPVPVHGSLSSDLIEVLFRIQDPCLVIATLMLSVLAHFLLRLGMRDVPNTHLTILLNCFSQLL